MTRNSRDNFMPKIQRFIEVFNLAARQAGYIARHLQGEISLRSKKGERSPEGEALTAADLAAQDVILLLLHSVFPDAAVDAEEKTDTVRLFGRPAAGKPLIVVDPIDGTLNYGRGSREYAVMGAWLEEERYRAALVHFPEFQETYWAWQEGGCCKESAGATETVRVGALPRRVRAAPSVPETACHALREAGFEVVRSRCSALDATAPATGRAVASLSIGRPSRRRAIGGLLTIEAGGVVRIGQHWWTGEDPATLPDERRLTIVADSRNTTELILSIVGGH